MCAAGEVCCTFFSLTSSNLHHNGDRTLVATLVMKGHTEFKFEINQTNDVFEQHGFLCTC
jgi:hypothetical protein